MAYITGVPLTPEEHINGIFSLIWVIIATAVGLVILLRYRKYKQNLLIYMAIGWIGMAFPWYPTIISYFIAVVDWVGLTLPYYLLIGLPFTAITFLFFSYVVMELVAKDKQKIVLVIFTIISIVFLIGYYLLAILLPTTIGDLNSRVDIKYSSIASLYSIYIAAVFLIMGLILAISLMRSDNKENRLKGTFLLICFISYTGAAVLDSFDVAELVVILRLILISAAIEMYIGWLMPDFIKKRLIKE